MADYNAVANQVLPDAGAAILGGIERGQGIRKNILEDYLTRKQDAQTNQAQMLGRNYQSATGQDKIMLGQQLAANPQGKAILGNIGTLQEQQIATQAQQRDFMARGAYNILQAPKDMQAQMHDDLIKSGVQSGILSQDALSHVGKFDNSDIESMKQLVRGGQKLGDLTTTAQQDITNKLEQQKFNLEKQKVNQGSTEIIQAANKMMAENPNLTFTDAYMSAKNGMVMGGKGQSSGVLPGDINTVPAEQQKQVKALVEGRMAFPTGYALKSPYWQNMLNLVSQYDPNFDAVNYNARAATRKDFTSGKSAQNITALNTAMSHLGSLADNFDSLNNSDYPMLNTITNKVGKEIGDKKIQEATTKVDSTAEAVAHELAKVFRSTGMSEGEIKAWKEKINTSNSPTQNKAVIDSALELMHGRLDAVGQQYNQGMGVTSDPLELMSPKAQAVYQKLTSGKTEEKIPTGKTLDVPKGWTIKERK